MQVVKLSSIKDGKFFFRSKRSKVKYKVIKKENSFVLFSAVLSDRTYVKKGKTLVFVEEAV